jgi:hypothetical protein
MTPHATARTNWQAPREFFAGSAPLVRAFGAIPRARAEAMIGARSHPSLLANRGGSGWGVRARPEAVDSLTPFLAPATHGFANRPLEKAFRVEARGDLVRQDVVRTGRTRQPTSGVSPT